MSSEESAPEFDLTASLYPKRRKRRVLLVNPKVQIGYALAVGWMIAVSVFVTAIIVYFTVSEVAYEPVDSGRYEMASELVHAALIWRISGVLIVLVFISIALTSYFLHRLVGPVYRIEQLLKTATKGNLITKVNLRKNDEFDSLAEALVDMFRTIKHPKGPVPINEIIAKENTISKEDTDKQSS